MRILVTAGPTREHLDEVRFLSSPSSGRMGFTIAEAARDRGHEVVLITGPVSLPDPEGVRVRRVVSALEMRDACVEAWPSADAVIMTASVADFRPAENRPGKLPKTGLGLTLELVANPDILAELGRTRRPDQKLVGFALQVENGPEEARRKLREKKADWIVLNDPGSFGAGGGRFRLFGRDGAERDLGEATKSSLADVILDLVSGRPEVDCL
jgi:phosphopantothenoylcysteine decarboxylase/phosphopantothenate--cysteine ligase